jgi:hypothetical protein
MNFKSFLSLRVPKLSGRSKFKNSVLINTLIIGAVPFFTGCAEHPVGAGGQSSAGAPVAGIVVNDPPIPPLREEVVTMAPDDASVWISGSWEWHGSWIWFSGHWAHRPYPSAEWARGHWSHRAGGHVWIAGNWR